MTFKGDKSIASHFSNGEGKPTQWVSKGRERCTLNPQHDWLIRLRNHRDCGPTRGITNRTTFRKYIDFRPTHKAKRNHVSHRPICACTCHFNLIKFNHVCHTSDKLGPFSGVFLHTCKHYSQTFATILPINVLSTKAKHVMTRPCLVDYSLRPRSFRYGNGHTRSRRIACTMHLARLADLPFQYADWVITS